MRYNLAVVSRAAVNIVSLDDAKRELDVTHDEDDSLIQQHIDAAIDWVENYTNLFLAPVVVDYFTDRFTTPLYIPRGPVNAITTISVDGVAVTGMQPIGGSPFAVLPPHGSPWPFTASGLGASVVRFAAGYAEGAIPQGILGAIRSILSIFYDKPVGSELTSQWEAVERMLSTYRLRSI